MKPPPEQESLQDYRDRLRDVGEAPWEGDATVRRAVKKQRPFNPYRILAATFVFLILVGTFLLCTPLSQRSGLWAWEVPGEPFTWVRFGHAVLDNLFMATSASCVTGLAVVDVPSTYGFVGQAVLLGCIQLGGISLVTLGSMIVAILLGRVPFGGERQLVLSFGRDPSGHAESLLSQTFRYVFGFELAGALLLFMRYHWHHGYDIGQSVWFALFHAVSAFCNAGISLHSENLLAMRGDASYMLIIAILVAAGGLGFLVLSNVFRYRFWRRDLRVRGRISLHSRLVLWMSLILTFGGGLLFAILEWNGSLSLHTAAPGLRDTLLNGNWGDLPTALYTNIEEASAALAQSVFFRTAGFNAIPMDQVSSPANVLSVLLMLVGGAPGSMAGGIKTTTLLVVLLTIRAYIRGNPWVQIHRRTIPDSICREAMVILFCYLVVVFLFYFILLFTEHRLIAERGEFALFYEVSSAIGTVGVTLNATPLLTPIGRLLIALAMFVGRIGPMSVALMMASRNDSTRHIRYPEETISVG